MSMNEKCLKDTNISGVDHNIQSAMTSDIVLGIYRWMQMQVDSTLIIDKQSKQYPRGNLAQSK